MAIKKPGFSLVVPSYNEEGSLEATCKKFVSKLERLCGSYEVLIIDDGSRDKTAAIADRMAGSDPHIKAFHNEVNRGLGYSLRRGMEAATKECLMFWAPGCDMADSSFENMIAHTDQADMVVSYIANPSFRPMTRRVISRGYTLLLNALFGLRLSYYNGATIYRTGQIQELLAKDRILSQGYVFLPELLIRMIKSGRSYVEAPVQTLSVPGSSSELGLVRKGVPTVRSLFQLYRALR